MGYLNGTRCYLCGPIDYAPDSGRGWRKNISVILQDLGVTIFDPTNKPVGVLPENSENVRIRHCLKEDGKFDELRQIMKEIRGVDLRAVDSADWLIALVDYSIKMCGVWDEIFQAERQRKPVLIMCPQGGAKAVSDWAHACFPAKEMFGTWIALENYIMDLDGLTSAPDKRWRLWR